MNKKYIVLLVVLLLMACIPFVPPIYQRYTKPLYKNYIDAKEWYGKVDCENLSQVRDYCDRRGYSTDYYIMVCMAVAKETQMPSLSSAMSLEVAAPALDGM